MNIKKTVKEKILPLDANFYAKKLYSNLLLNNAIARCAVAAATRRIDPLVPETWEFSGFSQNGEDGITDYLLASLKNRNKYFIEIGAGNGLENNTGYLAHIKKYSGLQVEGDPYAYKEALTIKPWLIEIINSFVNTENVLQIADKFLYNDPDFFSIDIDGMDYHILRQLMEHGFRPKIIVVEYNSAFGPEKSLTLPYQKDFSMFKSAYPYLYYGVSLTGWQKLLAGFGYNFLTVETNGVNGFFIRTNEFIDGLFNNVKSIRFKENKHQLRLFGKTWETQFELIKKLPFVEI